MSCPTPVEPNDIFPDHFGRDNHKSNPLDSIPTRITNMGCTPSIVSVHATDNNNFGFLVKQKRNTLTSIASLDAIECGQGHFGQINRRYGAPSYFKPDGYDLGLRVKV